MAPTEMKSHFETALQVAARQNVKNKHVMPKNERSPEGPQPMFFASVAKPVVKVAIGISIGLLSGYVSYNAACGPNSGTFWFWVQEPLLRRIVMSWELVGSALGALAPV